MRLLDRYVLRYFLQAYFYCIAGFISIWFISIWFISITVRLKQIT